MQLPATLIHLVSQQASQPAPESVQVLSEALLARHGEAVQAILFYGSCQRSTNDREGVVDLYLLVDSYRHLYQKTLPALLNCLLPPNVFYLEVPFSDRTARTKYAVISLADFERGTSMDWFQSYLWGRFAQPAGVLYAHNQAVRNRVHNALAQAVTTFITRTLPHLSPRFTVRELWQQGLALSYAAELRVERSQDRAIQLYETLPGYYEQITRAAFAAVPFQMTAEIGAKTAYYQARISPRVRYWSRLSWMLRRFQGKALTVLRLIKAVFTFDSGVDYILWKIQRHSGMVIEVTPWMRRHPLLAGWPILWRLYRRGKLH